jgi:hypothetical protein
VRLKRFLAKAKRGEGFTVGVVGGSGRSLYSKHSSHSTTHQLVGIHHYPPLGEGSPLGEDTSPPTSQWGDNTISLTAGTSRWDTLTTVSAGHGLHYNNIGKWSERETPLNMNRAIFNHLDSLFPAPGGQVIGEVGENGRNGFVNGAQGGTGEFSLLFYFSSCIHRERTTDDPCRDRLLFNVFRRTYTR